MGLWPLGERAIPCLSPREANLALPTTARSQQLIDGMKIFKALFKRFLMSFENPAAERVGSNSASFSIILLQGSQSALQGGNVSQTYPFGEFFLASSFWLVGITTAAIQQVVCI